MDNLIPTMRETWDEWNIRGVILISLGLQIFLILFSPLRKGIKNAMLTWSLWSAYLLADYTANFCIGLIFHKSDKLSAKDNILVFWAPFLLLHLGGQDTITAFSLEDNQLWLRHLQGFVFQVVTTVYIFAVTIHANSLRLPTVLVFFAGIIKYMERTRSLYLANMETFRKSVMASKQQSCPLSVRPPDVILTFPEPDQQLETAGPNMSNSADRTDDVVLVRKGYEYFKKFRGLVVDMTYSYSDRDDSRQYFINRKPEDALTIIEVELGFLYEYFFTKGSELRTKAGYVCRFAGLSSIFAANLVLFLYKKNGFSNFDIQVTYILLLGALALDSMALLMLIFSDSTATISENVIIKRLLMLKNRKWSNRGERYPRYKGLSKNPLFRRWDSGTISGHDFMTYLFHKRTETTNDEVKINPKLFYQVIDWFGANELVEKWRFKENHPFIKELWEFIFSELQTKSMFVEDAEMVKTICESTGGWIIRQGDLLEASEKGKLMPFANSNQVPFDETLVVWHIATCICYYGDVVFALNRKVYCRTNIDHRYISKVLSDYMFYLLAMEPSIMSAVAGIGRQRIIEMVSYLVQVYNDTLMKVGFDTDFQTVEGFCVKILTTDMCNDRLELTLPIFIKALVLARKIMELPEEKRWKIVAQVWVEMLSYAAINCRPDTFVQQLSKGGQLISIVWLLMLHLGLGIRQFRNE